MRSLLDAARFVEERQALRAERELRFVHRDARRRRQSRPGARRDRESRSRCSELPSVTL